MNEPHYFTNQKIVASDINETLNTLSGSLMYKMSISSTASHLSPIIDLSSATVKTVTNRIEKAHGNEDRFGRRDQVIEFYPVYQFNLAGNGGTEIQTEQFLADPIGELTDIFPSLKLASLSATRVYSRVA